MEYNTVVIGAGISGLSAGMYLKRAGISVCILEKDTPGGQLLRTSNVENYPGIEKTDGTTIALNIFKQVNDLDIPIKYNEIVSIEEKESYKIVETATQKIKCQNILIATGRNYKTLGLENEKKLIGKGISYCAICDGYLYKNKEVCVVGAGNSAFEESLYLSKICSKVTIIARSEKFRATNSYIEKVKETKNIEIIKNSEILDFIGDNQLESINIKDKDDKIKSVECSGCFIFIGQEPATKFLSALNLDMDDNYIITNNFMETNIKNIYAIGDCRKKDIYQLVSATNDALVASTQIIKMNELQ